MVCNLNYTYFVAAIEAACGSTHPGHALWHKILCMIGTLSCKESGDVKIWWLPKELHLHTAVSYLGET